jgi:hypothetical protein
MSEGHEAPPGTAEWGAEEVLNEGHEFPPPSEGWLREEEQELGLSSGDVDDDDESAVSPSGPPLGAESPELPPASIRSSLSMTSKAPPGMEDTVMKLKEEYPGEPEKAFATAWSIYNKNAADEKSKGNGIPLPKGKIKQQVKVQTYNKKLSPDGGKTLKSADVEARILDGKVVKVGHTSIHINDNDEVELWDRDAGRACGLAHLDTAIADFMLIAGLRKTLISTRQAAEGRSYTINVAYPAGKRDQIIGAVKSYARNIQVNDESAKGMLLTAWDTDDAAMDKANAKITQLGGKAEIKRQSSKKVSQMGAPAPAAPAAPMPAGPPPPSAGTVSDMPAQEVIQAGLTHYKSMGLGPQEALIMLGKDYKEREDLKTPENQMMSVQFASQLWGAASAPAQTPAAPGGEPSLGLPQAIASKAAQSKMKEPSIRKPKDHISVPKDLGPDSETKKSIPSPGGKIKSQPNKSKDQKMSPKELGEDSEGKDLLPSPGKPSMNHSPGDQKGVHLPNKQLDSDSEGNEPFATPGLGSSPSPRKK